VIAMSEVSLKIIHDELRLIQKDINLIKHLVSENLELNDETKKALSSARQTDEIQYLSQKAMELEFL
jgi:hypothetical protein